MEDKLRIKVVYTDPCGCLIAVKDIALRDDKENPKASLCFMDHSDTRVDMDRYFSAVDISEMFSMINVFSPSVHKIKRYVRFINAHRLTAEPVTYTKRSMRGIPPGYDINFQSTARTAKKLDMLKNVITKLQFVQSPINSSKEAEKCNTIDMVKKIADVLLTFSDVEDVIRRIDIRNPVICKEVSCIPMVIKLKKPFTTKVNKTNIFTETMVETRMKSEEEIQEHFCHICNELCCKSLTPIAVRRLNSKTVEVYFSRGN